MRVYAMAGIGDRPLRLGDFYVNAFRKGLRQRIDRVICGQAEIIRV